MRVRLSVFSFGRTRRNFSALQNHGHLEGMDEEVLFEADLGQESGPAGGHRATAITAPVSTTTPGLIRVFPSLYDACPGITGAHGRAPMEL